MTSKIESIAMVAHQVNKAYCESIGDFSQKNWTEAPDWQKESAIAGVQAIITNPNLTPEQSHEGWLAKKEADGWVYGDKKDPEAKTHPCILPYKDLPNEMKSKDHIFRAVVLSVMLL